MGGLEQNRKGKGDGGGHPLKGMSVLQKESAEEILRDAIGRAMRQSDLIKRKAKDTASLFEELKHAIRGGGMLRSISRFLVERHIEKPYLDSINAKGLYGDVLAVIDDSQRSYLELVDDLVSGKNTERCVARFRTSVLFKPTSGGGQDVLIAKMRMPALDEKELNGVLQTQESAFFRMASELDERVLDQYKDTHG